MNAELLAYPFLFAAIYFEAFLLVTFLSAPARATRERARVNHTPSVAIIVPCWNEAATVGGTAESVLALDYPKDKLRLILVNDGSTDATASAMDAFAGREGVTVVHQQNGGKHAALNAGIALAKDAELIGCLDADSFVEKNALREIIPCFDDPRVGAATAAMSIHKPRTLLEQMQNAEYVLGIALRHILASVNGLHVTPGPFSFYRRSIIEELGGFRHGHNTEDMEMALRIQRAGYRIDSAHTAQVFTNVPRTVPALVKQRVRWTTGFLRNVLLDYRDLVGNPRYGALGMLVLPLGFFAITGGVLLFLLAIYQLVSSSVSAYLRVAGIPLEYTLLNLLPRLTSFDWFYFPVTVFLMLAIVATFGSVLFILVGKRISQTPGSLFAGIIGYILLYGLIAPFWLVRSLADLIIGHKRSWR